MTRIDDRDHSKATPMSPALSLRRSIEQLIADDETSKTENQILVRTLPERTAVEETRDFRTRVLT
jgi:hypothetical protein